MARTRNLKAMRPTDRVSTSSTVAACRHPSRSFNGQSSSCHFIRTSTVAIVRALSHGVLQDIRSEQISCFDPSLQSTIWSTNSSRPPWPGLIRPWSTHSFSLSLSVLTWPTHARAYRRHRARSHHTHTHTHTPAVIAIIVLGRRATGPPIELDASRDEIAVSADPGYGAIIGNRRKHADLLSGILSKVYPVRIHSISSRRPTAHAHRLSQHWSVKHRRHSPSCGIVTWFTWVRAWWPLVIDSQPTCSSSLQYDMIMFC